MNYRQWSVDLQNIYNCTHIPCPKGRMNMSLKSAVASRREIEMLVSTGGTGSAEDGMGTGHRYSLGELPSQTRAVSESPSLSVHSRKSLTLTCCVCSSCPHSFTWSLTDGLVWVQSKTPSPPERQLLFHASDFLS